MLNQEEIKITDGGSIGICYLKLIWRYYNQLKINPAKAEKVDWKYINGVFNTVGIGLEPTIKYLMNHNNTFEEFENWIIKNGTLSRPHIDKFNELVSGNNNDTLLSEENVFSPAELEEWEKNGYIILRNAISKEDCEKTIELIYNTIGAKKYDTSTWYENHPLKQGIMVQLFNAPILDANRFSNKIRHAYQQLWNSKDLMVSIDRVSFNPPETELYKFPGPNLHWDVSLKTPIPFGLQGLLYLDDTAENQGAFTLIPGFHNDIESWLQKLDKDKNPRDYDLLNKFEKKPIAAEAGDFIIWNHCLPHGSSPNTSTKPRIVQYINYQPLDFEHQAEWI